MQCILVKKGRNILVMVVGVCLIRLLKKQRNIKNDMMREEERTRGH